MPSNETFQFLVKSVEDKLLQLKKLRDNNVEVFQQYDSIHEELNAAKELLKLEARKFALPSGKVVLVDDQHMTLSVTTTKKPFSYPWAIATSSWPQDLIDRVRVYEIDNNKVDQEIKLGYISIKDAEKVREYGVARAPAVEICFKVAARP